ncbi:intracellular protein transport protein USO1-like [Andrographis paniculata]|uniref:intracellular protein transport protein USO1-like n=1 Tax=Andrographis paniculata TaxID=175694 RepID=UPI0021E70274|nr:intracellular protein transport protein USO1-like [Andrographis paniculata]
MLRMPRLDNRPSKTRERVDFKFSNFQALQVPKGWDRLFVSLISVDTGKTLAKSGKALVKNGSCHWAETILESIYISNDLSSKGFEECPVRVVVSTGSTRSSTLGEVTINMAQYASSRVSTAVSQPLKKCSYGTILQFKVQCLSRRSKLGDDDSKSSNSQVSSMNIDQYDGDRKSDRSYSSSRSPREDMATTSHPVKSDSKGSASSSFQSFDSVDGSSQNKNLSAKNLFKEYDSHASQPGGGYDSSPLPDDFSGSNRSPSKQPSLNSRQYSGEDFRNEASVVSRSLVSNMGSSRSLLEVAEDTIEELRAEAKMWERNARKLMIDLDMSKKEYSDLSKGQAELMMQLSAAHAEQDGMKKEIEKMKLELQKSSTNQATREDAFIQSESWIRIQKELEDEIKHHQVLTDGLDQQLKQSQESNIALVSVLQELEETIEQQKIEIQNLSSRKLDFAALENSIAEKSEENQTSLLQLQQVQESEKKLQADVELLSKALKDKINELENERCSKREMLYSAEEDYKSKISIKDEEIASLKAMVPGYVEGKNLKELNEDYAEFMKEIESLREKIQELERDCAELTDENLELLYKLKELNGNDIIKCASFDSMLSEHPNISPSDGSEVSDPKEEEFENKTCFKNSEHLPEVVKQIDMAFQHLRKSWLHVPYENGNTVVNVSEGKADTRMSYEYILTSLQELNKLLGMRITESEEIHRNQEMELKEKSNIIADAETKIKETVSKTQELEELMIQSKEDRTNLMKELDQKISEFHVMEAKLESNEQEMDVLLQQRTELEAEITEIQHNKKHIEQNMELVRTERNTFFEQVENLQNDIASLRSTVSFHVSANSDLEKNIEELGRTRHELEHALSRLQEENVKLEESILGLKEEKETCQQEADKFKSAAVSLQDEVKKLKAEMDTQIVELKKMSEDMKEKWLGAQEECEYLKEENKLLQASATSFEEEIKKLQNLNSELKTVNQELEGGCSALAAQVSELKKSLSGCTLKNESLENHLTTLLDDFSMRENSLKSEIDALVKENSYQKEKLAQEGSLREMFLEQSAEFESLQNEIEHLRKQVSDAHCEKERVSSEASSEVSSLLAENAELHASIQEVHIRAETAENKLNEAQQESELQLKDLTDQLTISQQHYERLAADQDRILKSLANYKKSEEKLKTGMNDLELKLTISDYERQQLTKEMSILKAQLQSVSDLQNKVSNLKEELKECRHDKGKVELAMKEISRDYEELKAENSSLSEKVSVFQKTMSEFEECKRNKLALEAKLQQMEKELNSREMFCIQNDGLKNEIAEMKRANMHFQQKMYILEEERDENLKKAQSLEEDLKVMQERNNFVMEDANYHDLYNGSSHAMTEDHTTQQHMHEKDISNGLDDNNRSRVQYDRNHENYAAASKKSTVSGETGARERYERTKSSLHAELRELRERYLEMSLKYAEVEAQREDLVMKLKATRQGRKWFS